MVSFWLHRLTLTPLPGTLLHYRTRKPSAGSWVERRGGLTIGVFPTYAVGVDRETRWATIQVFQYPTALMG